MSLVTKTEPTSDVSTNMEEVSDDELSNMESPKINGVPSNISSHSRPGTPENHCAICLEELTNRCYTNMCFHMFCFECLKRWASMNSSCPLCKKRFQSINHSVSEYGHEIYEVPVNRISIRQFEVVDQPVVDNGIVGLPTGWWHNPDIEDISDNGSFTQESVPLDPRTLINLTYSHIINGPSFERRIDVYRLDLWTARLPNLSGRFGDCSATYFRENPAQVDRLHGFIFRDVVAIASIDDMRVNSNINELYILDLILQVIFTYEIMDVYTISVLRPYLGTYTLHFCYELYTFANSLYDDMLSYDLNMRSIQPSSVRRDIIIRTEQFMNQYFDLSDSSTPLPETIDSVDSTIDSVANISPNEVITIETTSVNDSDVEIIDSSTLTNLPIHLNPSTNLPSTSTGIRDSLDRPNNRYNLRRRRIIVDSSSSDEDFEPVTTRKRKIKKTKPRKKRIVEVSKTENRVRSRSEFSTSSCTD